MLQSGPRGNPAPPPRPSGISALPHIIAHAIAPVEHVAQVVQHSAPAQHYIATHSPPPPLSQARLTHVAGRTAPVASFEANSLPRAAYLQAVAQVFRSQSPQVQVRVARGLALQPHTPEFGVVRDVLVHQPLGSRNLPAYDALFGREQKSYQGADVFGAIGKAVSAAGRDVYGLMAHPPSPESVTGPQGQTTPAGRALTAGGAALGKLIDKIPTYQGTPEQQALAKQSGVGPGTLGKNFAKDVVNLPAEALPSVAIPVQDALSGNPKQALQDVVGPYKQLAHDPLGFSTQHPLDAALMFQGLLHPTARAVDTGASLARTGRLPDVRAEPIHLTAKLTHERPDFSKSPITRSSQKTVERQLYKRNARGQLEPRDENVRARLIKLEVSRLVGQNERVRRANREQQIAAHARTVLQPRAARAAHGVRTALQFNPDAPLIPGAGVLARIADATIRRPDTVAADLGKHLGAVAAMRPNLIGRPKLLAEHDAYVAELQKALNDKQFLRNPHPAFKAADQYARDFSKLEGKAHALGHFRDMTKAALERRALAHAVLTHMPGAHYDRTHGLMVGNRPLTTLEMRQFVAKETGGRPVAFTSDQMRAGDRAFYVNGQKRPLPAAKGNEYFAYTHGLTTPGHESLLEQRARTQGIVDAHESMNRLAGHLLLQNENTGRVRAWTSFQAAKNDAPDGYQPIRLAHTFHPQDSLRQAFDAGKVNLATLEEEAVRRNLDINSRLQPSGEPGTYGLIDKHAAAHLQAHENLISPGVFLRGFRNLTGQFRRVALSTSFRHLPGVAQEQVLRAAAEGIGPVSWFAGRSAMKRAREIHPELGARRRIEMTGGAASGQALALQTHEIARHYEGTLLHGPLNSFEKLLSTPGPRQMSSAWRQWNHFVLTGTKRFLEENAQVSAIGKQVIADFGGRHGVLAAALGNWGKMIDQAAHGILDEQTARRMGAYVRRVYGRWTDLTPGEQTALMFSPFGMWWTNSVAWLARMPIDHPAGAGFMAALNAGTAQERQKLGLDMFAPNHLPLFEQGSIPIGQMLWGANYYSAFGVANNPGETASSLFLPWQSELYNALRGKDWRGETINSPQNPKGRNKPTPGDVGTVVLNSLLGSFLPLYAKAQTLVQGGASSFDTSTAFAPKTKEPNPGLLAGLGKATMPIRLSKNKGGAGSSLPSVGGSGGWKVESFGGGGAAAGGSGGWKVVP